MSLWFAVRDIVVQDRVAISMETAGTSTGKKILWSSIALTVVLGAITCLLRFGLDLQATRDTASTEGRLTGGIRIHHGYIGIVVLVVALIMRRRRPRLFTLLLIMGIALLASDLIHHFIVLWIATGSPEFDLVYPRE